MKIAVIGAGAVGVSICNYILALGNCRELVLLDKNKERAEGELLDFGHTSALTFTKNTHLIATDDYEMLADSDIVVITAGAQIKEGQSRLALAEVNSRIGLDIAMKVEPVAPEAILIVVANPCDLITHAIIANTGFRAGQVLSSGCVVDTARLMKLVGDRVGIDPKNVFGYILGEHGSHCFMPWNLVSVAGQPIDYYCQQNGLESIKPEQLLEDVRQAGFEIFRRKQNTTHGVAASVFRIIQAITVNERSVLPVGIKLTGQYGIDDVVLSLPTIISRNGVEKILEHPFTPEDFSTLTAIASQMREIIESVATKLAINC